MDEKTINSIALHQMSIKELENIKSLVGDNIQEDVKFIIQTKHLVAHFDVHFMKRKTSLDISNYTMKLILDEAIKKEKERIDKLIDKEVDDRMTRCRIKD